MCQHSSPGRHKDVQRRRMPCKDCTFLLVLFQTLSLCTEEQKSQTPGTPTALAAAAVLTVCTSVSVLQCGGGAAPSTSVLCVCRELCGAGSQSVFVSVLKGDARCHCFVTEDRQSLLNINAHVLKVPGLPVDDN